LAADLDPDVGALDPEREGMAMAAEAVVGVARPDDLKFGSYPIVRHRRTVRSLTSCFVPAQQIYLQKVVQPPPAIPANEKQRNFLLRRKIPRCANGFSRRNYYGIRQGFK
jgi:hypothetical protein